LENCDEIPIKHVVCSFTYNTDATFYYLNLAEKYKDVIQQRKNPFEAFDPKTKVIFTTHLMLLNDLAN